MMGPGKSAVAVGGTRDRQRLPVRDHAMHLVLPIAIPIELWDAPATGGPVPLTPTETYHLQQIRFCGDTMARPRAWWFWVHDGINQNDALAKIMEGYAR